MHFADAIEGLLDSYNSIDIRTAAFIENNSWQSAVTVVRFRKESTDELEKIHAKLREENGIIENEIFRVSLHSYPITKWKSFRENWYKKFISLRDDYTVNIIGVGELNEEQTEPMDILNNDYVNKDWKSYCVSKHTSRTGINAKLKQHDKKAIENGFMSIQEYISTIFEIGGGMLGDQGNNMIVAPVYLRISSVEFEDKTIKINCSGIPSPLDLTVTFYELDHNKMPRNPKKRERFSYGPTGYSKSVQEFTITKELEDFSQEDYFRIRIFRKNVPVEYNSNYVNLCQTEPRFKISDEPFLKELFRLREYYQNLRQLLEVHFSGYTIKADENTNRIYLQLCLIIEEILNYPDFSELRKNDWKPLENLLSYHQDYAEEDWEYGGRQMCADFISGIEKLFIKHGQKEFQLEPQDIKNLDATQNFIQNYQIEKKESDIQFVKYAEKAGTEFNKKLSKTGKQAKPEPTHDPIVTRINITPTQGYAGDSIILEAWASEPDTAIHLDVIDENGKRRINTGQVVFDKPFKHVLTLSKHDFEPGTYNAVFYTTNIKENKTGTFEFLGSTSKQVAKPKQEDEKLSKTVKQEKKWDVFISHATEDKTIATPLAEKLREVGLNVWYDQYVLRWGDSLMGSINSGLKDSIFGIVILSNTFFKKQWTQTELKGLLALANATGEKKILPLLYKISHGEITEQYPILADIVARSWDDGLDNLANEVKEMVNEKKN